MIPSTIQAKSLWEKYHLPKNKRLHLELVATVAKFLAREYKLKSRNCKINLKLLTAGALLHDIDKRAAKLPGERHPDTAVRILREEGMEKVASLVKTHPLHAILDPQISPKTWEEKILFLADKMVKLEIMTVDKRFDLWRAEHLPFAEQAILEKAYLKVKELEKEIFDTIGFKPEAVRQLVAE